MRRRLTYLGLAGAALLGPRLFLFWHPMGVQTPAHALLWIGLNLLPFVVLFLAFRDDKRISQRRWAVFFTFLIVTYLLIDPFGSQFLSFLASNRRLLGLIEGAVMAGDGWLLPLLMLATFLAFILLKHKSSP